MPLSFNFLLFQQPPFSLPSHDVCELLLQSTLINRQVLDNVLSLEFIEVSQVNNDMLCGYLRYGERSCPYTEV